VLRSIGLGVAVAAAFFAASAPAPASEIGADSQLQVADESRSGWRGAQSTVRYDLGAPADAVFGGPGLAGNLFNTRLGDPLGSGSVSGASLYLAYAKDFFSGIFFYGPVVGTQAPRIGAVDFPIPPSDTFYAVTFSPIAVPSSFLAGIRAFLEINVGMRSGSVSGQGFHGRYWFFDGSGNAVSIRSASERNAMLRLSGSFAAVPVELMEFDVEWY